MSERMIEELAKAICCPDGCKYDPALPERACGSWYWHDEARAVLTRLREPTPGMVNSGAIAALETREAQRTASFHSGAGDEVRASFRAMIDAAMEGK